MPTLTFFPYSDFLSIVGVKASGKTIYTKTVAKSLTRLIVIDPTWQLGELGYVVNYPERVAPAFQQFNKVIYQPKKDDELSYQTVFKACLRFTNYTLVIDEVDSFASSRRYICPEVKALVVRGRAQGIGLIVNTRRPSDIHKDIRSSSDHVVSFRLGEESDRKYVANWIGISETKLFELADYHSYYYNSHTHKAELQQPVAF